MKSFLYFILLTLLLLSCKSHHTCITRSDTLIVTRTDTVQIERTITNRDSVLVRDSIIIYVDTSGNVTSKTHYVDRIVYHDRDSSNSLSHISAADTTKASHAQASAQQDTHPPKLLQYIFYGLILFLIVSVIFAIIKTTKEADNYIPLSRLHYHPPKNKSIPQNRAKE